MPTSKQEKSSDQIVIEALIRAKTKFGVVIKNKKNPYHKYNYADLDAIYSAIMGPLIEEGFFPIQSVEQVEGKSYLVTKLIHNSGHFNPLYQASSFPLPDITDSQKLGSAITYARRYDITCLLSLVAESEDDGNSTTTITRPQSQQLVVLAQKNNWPNQEVTEIIKKRGYEKASQLDITSYQYVLEKLNQPYKPKSAA